LRETEREREKEREREGERGRERERERERAREKEQECVRVIGKKDVSQEEWYGVASISRLLKIIGLFCKRAL